MDRSHFQRRRPTKRKNKVKVAKKRKKTKKTKKMKKMKKKVSKSFEAY